MKKNKLLSLLLLPVLAVTTLVGCGSSKTSVTPYATLLGIQARYGTYGTKNAPSSDNPYEKASYATENTNNNMFYVIKGDTDAEVTYLLDPIYDIAIMTNSNIAKLRNKQDMTTGGIGKSSKQYKAFYAIYKIQDSVVKGVYNYYNHHAAEFYQTIANLKVTKAEVKEFNKRVDALSSAVDTFNNSRNSFVLSCNNAVSDINTFVFSKFSRAYNDLIESSINFVDYFKDLHLKYVIGNKAYTSEDTALRVKDEMILNVAKVLYYEDLKAFNYTGCDLTALATDLVTASNSEDVDNPYAKVLFTYLSKNTSSINLTDGNTDVYTLQSNAADLMFSENSYTFRAIIAAFNQKYPLYKSVYDSLDDIYSYNIARSTYDSNMTEDKYVQSADSEAKSKYAFIKDFHLSTFSEYANFVLKAGITK